MMALSHASTDREPGGDPAAKIVANLQAGISVEESFQRLFRQYHPVVENYFRTRRCAPHESEDLAQSTFIKAFQGIYDFRNDASFKTWLLSVARNVWLNELRRRSAAKRAAGEVPLDDGNGGEVEGLPQVEADALLDQLLREERRQTLMDKLQELPPQMRRCVILRVVHDMQYSEIAEVLGVSIQTVRSQLFQARKRLRETLEGVEYHG